MHLKSFFNRASFSDRPSRRAQDGFYPCTAQGMGGACAGTCEDVLLKAVVRGNNIGLFSGFVGAREPSVLAVNHVYTTYIHMHVYLCIHTHVFNHLYLYVCTYVCNYVCICMYLCMVMRVCTQVCTYVCVYVRRCVCMKFAHVICYVLLCYAAFRMIPGWLCQCFSS